MTPPAAPSPFPSPSSGDMPPTLLDLGTYLLSRIGRTARVRLGERLAGRGLRLWDMAVLAALADFGPHAQRELCERLALDPSDLAKIADQLAAGGYVERARDSADRRRVSVSVTDAGRALLAELDAEARSVQDEVLAPLDAEEREVLQGLLLRVHAGLTTGRLGL
ncbi:MarR family winged helix-turn-helix transcriptional regulator [Kitasatospora sp. NPDC059747]|uniref:MarR family winged helix-turn-helix transcriptional regulator n=1 Tax=Kitasatospora sp. NPDC059747 TaxID=3346930 RepID=UPI00364C8B21